MQLAKALAQCEIDGKLEEMMSNADDADYIEWSRKMHWRYWAEVQAENAGI